MFASVQRCSSSTTSRPATRSTTRSAQVGQADDLETGDDRALSPHSRGENRSIRLSAENRRHGPARGRCGRIP